MKKIFYTFSPLLCSSMLYHKMNGMQQEKFTSNILTEQSSTELTQEQIDLTISAVISSPSIQTSNIIYIEEVKKEQPSGFSWKTYFQSFAYSKPTLTIKTLENDGFQPNNKDHITLLTQAIKECIQQKNNITFSIILNLIDQKHNNTIKISSLELPKTQFAKTILENDMFKPENKDHVALLEEALDKCVEQQYSEILLHILDLLDQKYKNEITINPITSHDVCNYLYTIQNDKVNDLKTIAINKHNRTMTKATEIIHTLEQQHFAAKNEFDTLLARNAQESVEKHRDLAKLEQNYQNAIKCIKAISSCYLAKNTMPLDIDFNYTAQQDTLKNASENIITNAKNLHNRIQLIEAEKIFYAIEDKQ